jgi:beta-mannosidase
MPLPPSPSPPPSPPPQTPLRSWPTGGWGSVEYGTTGYTDGQVVGGRWKPLHHMMSTHLYVDQIAVCGNDGRCYVRNDDALNPFTGSIAISFVHLATGAVTPVQTVPVALARGAAAQEWFCLGAGSNITAGCTPLANVLTAAGCGVSGSDCFLVLNTTSAATGAVTDLNWQVLTAPGNLTLPAAHVTFAVGQPNADGTVPVTVSADATALYVYLSTTAAGRFSDNSFHLASGTGASTTVTFMPFGPLDLGALTSTLRVEHLQGALNF